MSIATRAERQAEDLRRQPQATGGAPAGRPVDVRCAVMVVDDSSVVRGFIVRMLESDPEIRVVASVDNGRKAVDRLRLRSDVDVIVLDIEMPVMDGLTALGALLEIDPAVQVVMASTLTQHNAQVSLRALEKGAADYIPKPTARNLGGNTDFRRELLEKVKTLAAVRRRRNRPAASAASAAVRAAQPAAPGDTARTPAAIRPVLRPASGVRADILAIGCSTGGPQALAALLKELRPQQLRIPVLITQHMPPTFTAILAEHLRKLTGAPCAEAQAGEPLLAGRIYVAPGDHHLLVEAASAGSRVRLTQDPPENFCRPSVDPMLRSLARSHGRRALALILTGMGSDGLAGSRALVEAGGSVVAQDQASSVVWGMPGAVAAAGLCCAIEPLHRIAATVQSLIGGSGSR